MTYREQLSRALTLLRRIRDKNMVWAHNKPDCKGKGIEGDCDHCRTIVEIRDLLAIVDTNGGRK